MKKCIYCGENPIPHRVHWFYESFDILMSPIKQALFYGKPGLILGSLTDFLVNIFYYTFKSIGLIRFNENLATLPYKRAKVLWEEANRRGIKMVEIKPFGLNIDFYKAKIKNTEIFFMGLPRPKTFDDSTLAWIDDKHLLKQKISSYGLPHALGGTFTRIKPALKLFDSLNKPVVIKPRLGSRGRHTTTFINTPENFIKAFKIAKQLCHWVIVEEQLFGPVYRGTIIGGKLIGVLGGSPPQIIGDGKNSIKKLIEVKNLNRHLKQGEVKLSEHLSHFLARNNFTLETILPSGQTLDLSEKIGVAYGGTSFDATKETHPDTKEMLEKASRVINNPILGFDFIISDISKSYKEQKSGIIECNGAPFINLHHDPLIGSPINAAKYVWDLIDK